MSAIWGIIDFENEHSALDEQFALMNQCYYQKCHFDKVNYAASPHAQFACGMQWINNTDCADPLPVYHAEESLLLTADCILDNRRELLQLLHITDEISDGELVWHAYLHFKQDFTKYLRGIYAIAIWNESQKELILVSDHTSSRCLYYCRQGTQLVFSTLLKPILQYFPSLTLNLQYEKDFLLADASVIYAVPGETPFQDIRLITPATILRFTKDYQKEHTYWSLKNTLPINSKLDYTDDFTALYQECVSDAIRNQGNTAIAMSSGLDSASAGVLAARLLANKNQNLFAYTYIPYTHASRHVTGNVITDESNIVREIASLYPNIIPHTLDNHGENAFSSMDTDLRIMEMPFKSGLFANMREICHEAQNNRCKVLLHGAYGNNTVSYGDIYYICYDLYKHKEYGKQLKILYNYCRHEGRHLLKEYPRMLQTYRKAPATAEYFRQNFIPQNTFLREKILDEYPFYERTQYCHHLALWYQLMDAEAYYKFLDDSALMMYLGIFETKYGLAHGMVLRDPTKDMRLLQFCRNIPYSSFAKDGTPRRLIRHGFKGLLPDIILDNWNCRGLQLADWLTLIQRDWNSIAPKLINTLQDSIAAGTVLTDGSIDYQCLLKYIRTINFHDISEQRRMHDVLSIFCLIQFCNIFYH